MTDRIIRIKASRDSYRRGGLALGPRWLEVDTSSLSPRQQRAVLADTLLTIEGREDDGSWSPLPTEIRLGLLDLMGSHDPDDDQKAEGAPDRLTLIVDAWAEVLPELGIDTSDPTTVLSQLIDLVQAERGQAEAALSRLRSDVERITKERDGLSGQVTELTAALATAPAAAETAPADTAHDEPPPGKTARKGKAADKPD